VYLHGWKFNVDGQARISGSAAQSEKTSATSQKLGYPVREWAGLSWGTPRPAAPLPAAAAHRMDFLRRPASERGL